MINRVIRFFKADDFTSGTIVAVIYLHSTDNPILIFSARPEIVQEVEQTISRTPFPSSAPDFSMKVNFRHQTVRLRCKSRSLQEDRLQAKQFQIFNY